MKDNNTNQTMVQPQKDDTISRRQADMLILIDIVTEASRKVELIDRDALFAQFSKRAATAPLPKAHELTEQAQKRFDEVLGHGKSDQQTVRFRSKKEMKESADEVPSLRAQREVFSRREILATLLTGNVSAALEAAQANQEKSEAAEVEPGEQRDITPEYFDGVLADVLSGDYGIGRLESWDHKEYFHFRPLLSASYARILSTQNNPVEMMVDMVRESSRTYPAPVAISVFEDTPFSLQPEQIQEILKHISEDPQKKDIRFTTSSMDTVFLYSNKYLDDDYAEFLAEEQDTGAIMNP